MKEVGVAHEQKKHKRSCSNINNNNNTPLLLGGRKKILRCELGNLCIVQLRWQLALKN